MEKNFDASVSEIRWIKEWEKKKAFKAGVNAKKDAKAFSIMIPPPNVTGSLHMGHAFNNTLQDILIRWHRMRGFDTLWQPGQDHAGIATQMVVERELKKEGKPDREVLGRDRFLQAVWEWKEQSGSIIIEQLKRLGASCDWDRNRFTMDPGFQEAVIKVFVELYQKGIIYRGKRLVNWDPHFKTAISDLEVEQVEIKGSLWRFKYFLEEGETYEYPTEVDDNGKIISMEERNFLVVATTRPETMLGDTGVAVNPEDARYRSLIGKNVVLPMVNRLIPIVADIHADPNKGTGVVKITPAHDFNDYEVGRRKNLRSINILNETASIMLNENKDFLFESKPSSEILALDGLDRYDARKQLIQLASLHGWLEGVDPEPHMVPHGDRSGVAIEPMLTLQWFVDTKKIVGSALSAVKDGRTKIFPEQHAKVYFHWLENIEPWCISRQLWWGHQIPVWYDKAGNEFCASSEKEARIMAGNVELTQDPDVLDTWFSSGLWPIGTLGWPENTVELQKYFPTTVLITGFDIIFFWVARMMMMQLEVVKEVPFEVVYVHALVRDEKGKKMSKSKGNILDPLTLIDQYGADSVRFTLAAMAAMGRDLKLSANRIAGYRNFGTKLWNAARYAEMNSCTPCEHFDPSLVRVPLNKWIISETVHFKEKFDEALSSYRFNDAAACAYAHIWGRFCDWYLEFSKPLFELEDDKIKNETRKTMAWALDQCLIILHPIMPFITEELWNVIAKRPKLLVHTDWPDYCLNELVDKKAKKEIDWVINLIEEVRSIRVEMGIPPKEHVILFHKELENVGALAFQSNQVLVRRLSRISSVELVDEAPEGAVTISVEGGEFYLQVKDFIDVSAENTRLSKLLVKFESEIDTLERKLQNKSFLANAPQEVIRDCDDRLIEIKNNVFKLNQAKDRINSIG